MSLFNRLKYLLLLVNFGLPNTVFSATTLNVMTSYPQQMVAIFQEAFEQAHPDIQLNILWRRPHDALSVILQGETDVDVLWMPSVRSFVTLKAADKLQPMTWNHQTLPVYLDKSAISDPEGHYVAVEIAGYVLFYDPLALEKSGHAIPQSWQDLMSPTWANHVILPIPSQVGFAPLLIDQLLQAEGWQAGWQQWQQIAANSQLVGSGGPFITEKVLQGQALVGLTMDFFAASTISNEQRGAFRYPQQTAFNPAHAAILNSSSKIDIAQKFIDYLLSEAGQLRLRHPDIKKLPVRPSVYAQISDIPNPFSGEIRDNYDATMGLARQGLNTVIFDAAITDNHADLKQVWQLWYQKSVGATEQQRVELERLRSQLQQWPVLEPTANDPMVLACEHARHADNNTECQTFKVQLTNQFRQQYQSAIQQLNALP